MKYVEIRFLQDYSNRADGYRIFIPKDTILKVEDRPGFFHIANIEKYGDVEQCASKEWWICKDRIQMNEIEILESRSTVKFSLISTLEEEEI